METTKINKSDAIKLYKGADESGKKVLLEILGKEYFDEARSILDQIGSVEDALTFLGIKESDILIPCPHPLLSRDIDSMNAQALAILIARAINEGWEPNWDDANEQKWYPFFKRTAKGFGFSHAYYGYTDTSTATGSRLCFQTEAKAKHFGIKFEALCNKIIELLPKA
jgi:hypothetical protein